jgi:uncharacterized protein involved in cysteine biosynthesis
MLALVAAIFAAVAGILKLVDKHPDWIVWLLIIGLFLVSLQVMFGFGPLPWRRNQ